MSSQNKAKLAPLEPSEHWDPDIERETRIATDPRPRDESEADAAPRDVSSGMHPPMTERARNYADELKRFYEDLRSADSTELDKQLEKVERDLFKEYSACRRSPTPSKKLLN